MKASLYIGWNSQQMVEIRELKKKIGGDASILINQIVSKLGMGTSFTHKILFLSYSPP